MASVLKGARREDGARRLTRADTRMNAVICIFNIDKEGFHRISSIKTDIFYRLGWLCFAATSKWTRDYGRTRSTFQNKPRHRLAFPISVLSPQDRQILKTASFNLLEKSLSVHDIPTLLTLHNTLIEYSERESTEREAM